MPETKPPILMSVESTGVPCPSTKDFVSVIQNNWKGGEGYFVAYLHYRVLIGQYNGRALEGQVQPEFVMKLRLFNESQELYVWRNAERTFSGRVRTDGEGDSLDVVDAWQTLYGTRCSERDGTTYLTEERGTNLELPFTGLKENHLPIRLHTRNYIGYNKLGQAGYEDCRFVAFTDKNGDTIGG